MASPLSQLGNQLATIWRQLGINQRLSVVLAGLVVVGGLIGLSAWSSRAEMALLYGKLDEAEAGRVVAALTDNKVPYRVQGGGSIYVPADKVHALRMQLAAKGIPKGDGVGFEIFDKPNFGISDFVQRANYLRAVQGELARTISQLDEIEAARVMLVMPENRLLVDAQRRSTASVFIRVRGNTELAASAVNSIRFLVANSVEGLQPNNVSVVDNRGNVLTDNTENDSVAGLSAGQMGARRNIEQYLAQKAQGMLEKVLGPGQAVVRVAVEINTETINRIEEKFDPDGQVARSTTSTEENNDSNSSNGSGTAGGVVGVAANVNPEANAASSTASVTRQKRKTVTSQYEINKSVSTILQSAGGLQRVSAAVFIAAKAAGAGAERKAVPRTPEEIEKLRRIVQSALGLQVGDAGVRTDEITLEEMPFNDTFPVEVAQHLDQQQKHAEWWALGQNIGYGLAALAILFVFWRAVKRATSETIVVAPGANGKSPGEGAVTAEVLNRLIRDNPSNMNQAVRTWLAPGPGQRN